MALQRKMAGQPEHGVIAKPRAAGRIGKIQPMLAIQAEAQPLGEQF